MLKIWQSYDAVEDVYRIYFAIALPHIVFAEEGGKLQAAFVELLEKYCSKARYARAMCGKDVLNVGVCWSDEEQGFRLLYPAINEKTPEQKEFPGVQWGMYFPPEMVAKLGGVNAVWEWNALEVIRELENGGIWVQVSDDIDIYPYRNCVVLYEKLSEYLWHGKVRINSMRFPSFRLPVKRENIRLIGGTDVDCIV